MSNVVFKPFVGKNYNKGLNGRKILVLGDSHYGSEKDVRESLTTEVVKQYLNKEGEFSHWWNTFKKAEKTLIGKETTPAESIELWNSIAFYNYVQCIVPDTRLKRTKEEYDTGKAALIEVLEQLEPDYVVCWGGPVFNNLPKTYFTEDEGYKVEGYPCRKGHFDLPNGKRIEVTFTHHPSTRKYNYLDWFKVLEAWWK